MRYKRLVLHIMTAILILYACTKDKLNQPALGLVDEATLANKNGVEGLLIGAYSLLDGVSSDSYGGWSSAASNWIYGSICGSEAYKGSYAGDIDQINVLSKFTSSPSDAGGDLDRKWVAVYAGVARANSVLRVMRLAKDILPDDTVQIHAEAVFLRAFYHFEAKKMWNKIPFVDETVTYSAGNYYINNDTSWSFIESDLKYAMDSLPLTQASVGRANKYAAEAFLAKAYMFQHKYWDAKPLLKDLIENGKTARGDKYELEKYGDNFNPETKNGSESVFSAQTSVNDFGSGANGNFGDGLNFPSSGGPGGCCGFFQPSQWLVNHFRTDTATGLPDLDHFNDGVVENDEGYASDTIFTPYTGTLDPRLDWTVGRRGVPYLDWGPHPGMKWIVAQGYMGPYTPRKNTFKESQAGKYSNVEGSYWVPGLTANNVNLIRFADILLWAAEAEVETGYPDKARDYVNRVRARAADSSGWVKNSDNELNAKAVTRNQAEFDVINVPSFTGIQPFDWVVRKDLDQTWVLLSVKPDGTKVWNAYNPPRYKIEIYKDPWTDADFARKAVRYERVLELAMEGHRFFDLVRWGIADQEINAYFQKEKTRRDFLKEPTEATFTKGKNEYFPIPQNEIDLSVDAHGVKHLHQNPGY